MSRSWKHGMARWPMAMRVSGSTSRPSLMPWRHAECRFKRVDIRGISWRYHGDIIGMYLYIYIYVCVCMYLYIYMCVCMYVCMYIYICMWYIYIYICIYLMYDIWYDIVWYDTICDVMWCDVICRRASQSAIYPHYVFLFEAWWLTIGFWDTPFSEPIHQSVCGDLHEFQSELQMSKLKSWFSSACPCLWRGQAGRV